MRMVIAYCDGYPVNGERDSTSSFLGLRQVGEMTGHVLTIPVLIIRFTLCKEAIIRLMSPFGWLCDHKPQVDGNGQS